MSKSKTMSLSVGIILTTFFFIFGNILLFGIIDTTTQISNALFKTIYFLFTMIILWVIYLLNRNLLHSKTEHFLIIFALIIFSASMTTLASNLKGAYDINQYITESGTIEQLQAQNENYYEYEQTIIKNVASLKLNNKVLEDEVEKLTNTITNKEPIIVETIIIVPAEIIYEEEPIVYRERDDDDDEREHEEDDDD